MANALIRPMSGEYEEYLRDESRSVGKAESISFPRTTEEVSSILKDPCNSAGVPHRSGGGGRAL